MIRLLQTLISCAVLLYCAWMMHDASIAMQKASSDFRDAWQAFYSQEARANYELGQMAKDRIRIRELLKKMEGKNGRPPADKSK